MEISQILEEDPDFTTMDTRQERMELEKSASLSDQALEILDRYAPEKKSMFSALEGKALIEAGDYEKCGGSEGTTFMYSQEDPCAG